MKFGQTRVLQTAKGKIAVGIALIFFGVVAILAAPTATDKLICGLIVLTGVALIVLGIRQNRTEKNQFRDYSKEAK